MIYDFKLKNIQNRFKSEVYLNEIKNVLNEKEALYVEELFEYLSEEINRKVNIIINKDFIPLLKSYMKNSDIDWYESKLNENVYIRYTENRDNKVHYTVGSLLSYCIKEVELEKILWRKIEKIMNAKIFQQQSQEVMQKSFGNSTIYIKIRSHFLHSLFFQFKNIYIEDLIEKESVERINKKENTSHIMIQISDLIFNNKEKHIKIISYDVTKDYYFNDKNEFKPSDTFIRDLMAVTINGGYILFDEKSNMSLSVDKDLYIRKGLEIKNRKVIKIKKDTLKSIFNYKAKYKIIFDDFKD